MTSMITEVPTALRSSGPVQDPGGRVEVRLVTASQLTEHLDAWNELAAVSVVPNVFYEPWMLLPALEATPDATLRFLLVIAPDGESLWGFFPLEIQPRCLRLPIRALAFWQHRYCYLTLPLLHRRHVTATLDAFWRWFEANPLGCRILDTNWLLADGPFHAAWTEFTIGRTGLLLNDFPRALFQPAEPVDAYLQHGVSRKGQHQFLRRERRLAEIGRIEYKLVKTSEEAAEWVEDFLRLEATGWKGDTEQGRAFGLHAGDTAYFRAITRAGFEQKRVLLISLTLDGRPIAMRHSLLAGCGTYAFRTTYDEQYAKYSPGVLIELETMRQIETHPELQWMDSCAAPRHAMYTRIWRERRMLRRSLFSNGSNGANFLVSAIPLARWLGKLLRPRATPAHLQVSTRLKSTDATR